MKAIVQEDDFGCAVACVAFVLGIKYQEAVFLFENGEARVSGIPDFYCREIVLILGSNTNQQFDYKYIKPRLKKKIYEDCAIVFIKKSKKYKYGHYLVRSKDTWMDPWINFPDKNRKAGFRKRLPGRSIYMIYNKEKSP
jgi:hypothetical protein